MKQVEPCGPDVAMLRRSIKKLENKVLIKTWQVQHLQRHKYFRPFQHAVSDAEAASGENHNSSTDTTLMKPLPPAGSLIVHDKGEEGYNILKVR